MKIIRLSIQTISIQIYRINIQRPAHFFADLSLAIIGIHRPHALVLIFIHKSVQSSPVFMPESRAYSGLRPWSNWLRDKHWCSAHLCPCQRVDGLGFE